MNSTTDDDQRISQLETIGLLLTRYCLIVVFSFGVIGNLLNVLIFRQAKFQANACSFYLFSTSISNIIWLSSAALIRVLSTFELDLSEKISAVCKIRQYIVYTLQSLSALFIGLAAVDRYLISSKKLEYRRMSSLRNAQRIVVVSTLIYCTVYSNMWYCLNIVGKTTSNNLHFGYYTCMWFI